jgi:hypothetical protein
MNQRFSADTKVSLRIGRHLLDFGASTARVGFVVTAPAGAAPTAAHQLADSLLGLARQLRLSLIGLQTPAQSGDAS